MGCPPSPRLVAEHPPASGRQGRCSYRSSRLQGIRPQAAGGQPGSPLPDSSGNAAMAERYAGAVASVKVGMGEELRPRGRISIRASVDKSRVCSSRGSRRRTSSACAGSRKERPLSPSPRSLAAAAPPTGVRGPRWSRPSVRRLPCSPPALPTHLPPSILERPGAPRAGATATPADRHAKQLGRTESLAARLALDRKDRREARAAGRAAGAQLASAGGAGGGQLLGPLLEVALGEAAGRAHGHPVAEHLAPLLAQPISCLAHRRER
jgi:hypothetical protein